MTCLVIITEADLRHGHIKPVLQWARMIADSDALQVLCCFTREPAQSPYAIPQAQALAEPGLLGAVAEIIGESGAGGVELLALCDPDPVKPVLGYIEQQAIDCLIFAAEGAGPVQEAEARLCDRLLRFAPCDTIVLDPGGQETIRLDRILVPAVGSLARMALRTADMIAGDSIVVAPLLVGQRFGEDAEEVLRKELDLILRDCAIDLPNRLEPLVVLADRWQEGIIRAGSSSDLVLIGASSMRSLRDLRQTENKMGISPDQPRAAIAVGRPAKTAGASRWKEATESRFKWLPKLKPIERVDIFDRLQAGARPNVDFLVMMGLSTAIASLGLLQSSTAVVIGAMLVAPLMTPLIAAGLSLVQGNLRLFRQSITAMALGILTGFLLAMLIGLLTPHDDLTIEVLARGSPDILDLFVAFISGMAAAYAFARPNLMGTLAGVAIAAALVPPLAASALALARWVPAVAQGAAILHLTNLVAIILGAALVFRILGVHGTRTGIGASLWARRAVLSLVLLSALLIAPLGYQLAKRLEHGQMRPLAFPLTTRVYEALEARIKREAGVRLVLAGRSGFVEELDATGILLSTNHPVSDAFVNDLKKIVKKLRGKEEKVEVWLFLQAVDKPAGEKQ